MNHQAQLTRILMPSCLQINDNGEIENYGENARQSAGNVIHNFKPKLISDNTTERNNAITYTKSFLKELLNRAKNEFRIEISRLYIGLPPLPGKRLGEYEKAIKEIFNEFDLTYRVFWEPLAVFVDYYYNNKRFQQAYNQNVDFWVIVVDWGGYTCGVSVVNTKREGKSKPFYLEAGEVGGQVFDRALSELILEKYFENAVQITNNILRHEIKSQWIEHMRPQPVFQIAVEEFKKQCVQNWEEESWSFSFNRGLGNFRYNVQGNIYEIPRDIPNVEISRSDFEGILMSSVGDRVKSLIQDAIKQAERRKNISADDIRYCLVAGGMSKIPLLKEWLNELLPQAEILNINDPECSVARGLAWRAWEDNFAEQNPNLISINTVEKEGVKFKIISPSGIENEPIDVIPPDTVYEEGKEFIVDYETRGKYSGFQVKFYKSTDKDEQNLLIGVPHFRLNENELSNRLRLAIKVLDGTGYCEWKIATIAGGGNQERELWHYSNRAVFSDGVNWERNPQQRYYFGLDFGNTNSVIAMLVFSVQNE